MKRDYKFTQKYVEEFLEATFTDVRKSDKSVYEYFKPDMLNKRNFSAANQDYKYGRNGKASFFEDQAEAEGQWDLFVDVIFAKMLKDFHDKTVYLYLPNKDGDKITFSSRQKQLIRLLGAFIINQVNGTAMKGPATDIPKLIEETTKRLEKVGKLQFVKGLKFNPETGLIEGEVKNPKDLSSGAVLTVKINPSNPDLLMFNDGTGKMAFMMENTDKDVSLFMKMNSNWEVMTALGYLETENGVMKHENEDGLINQPVEMAKQGGVVERPEGPAEKKVAPPQEQGEFESRLRALKEPSFGGVNILPEGTLTGAGALTPSRMKYTSKFPPIKQGKTYQGGDGAFKAALRGEMPLGKTRITEDNLKKHEKAQVAKKAEQKQEQRKEPAQKQGQEGNKVAETVESKTPERKGGVGKMVAICTGGCAAGAGGLIGAIVTGII